MESAQLEHERDMASKRHADQLQRGSELEQAEVEGQAARNEVQISRLTKLKDMGVDLTQLLVAEQRAPDKHWQIDGVGANRGATNLHIHE